MFFAAAALLSYPSVSVYSFSSQIVESFALFDAESNYMPHIDLKFSGYGPGTPMRVIKIFRGAPTPTFPNGEPRLKYKLAAQYDTWYPTDCPDGAPILISMPAEIGPALMPQKNWDKFDFIKQNIMVRSLTIDARTCCMIMLEPYAWTMCCCNLLCLYLKFETSMGT